MDELTARMKRAWQGRVSGCMLGKAVEVFSMTQGRVALTEYLTRAGALPLRGYIPQIPDAPDALFTEVTPRCYQSTLPRPLRVQSRPPLVRRGCDSVGLRRATI
jgi:hypothetical protein